MGLISISGYGMRMSLAYGKHGIYAEFVNFQPGTEFSVSNPNRLQVLALAPDGGVGAQHAFLSAAMPTLIQNQVTLSFGRLEISCAGQSALTLENLLDVFPTKALPFSYHPDPAEAAYEVCDILRERCSLRGSHEHLFLLLYFNRVIERMKSGAVVSNALLPLPKARFSMAGRQNSVMVDFAFWTGERFVAVFIHESPFDRHGRLEESLLKVWGFDVYCLMAEEFETRGLMGDTGRKILAALDLA
jgi:hypothetical protein